MVDIAIKTELRLGSIVENFDEIKAVVVEGMKQYEGLVFADADIKEAKATRAKLNGLREQVETRRIAMKKQWNEPYVAFESKVKDVLVLIENPIREIDAQVKDFEERKREEKRQALKEMVDEILAKQDESTELFARKCNWTYDPKWENASVPLTTASREFSTKIEYIAQAMGAIDDGNKYAAQGLGAFQETGDLTTVLKQRKQLETRDREYAEERERQAQAEAERKARIAAAEPAPTPAPVAQIAAPVQAPAPAAPVQPEPVKILTVAFRVEGTLAQHQALVAFLKSSNMRFERIKE